MTETEIHEQFVETYMHILKYIGDFVSVPTRPYKITFEAYVVMRMIATSKDPLTLVKIANAQHVSRSAIARQINVLLDLKYIDQTTNTHDRRIKYLSLTPDGLRVEQAIDEASEKRFHQWLQVYGEQRADDTLRYITDAEKKATALGFSGFSGLHDKRSSHKTYSDPEF
ncbi:MarR family winged helix-turn-helix transcriptional regulator [Lactiplantibacillus mudanjiangensis]|uniref:MarR family transcriptional regulator [Lactobacillus sp.] n=1 Tax=Lactiplantibacillus mudanjiangensis TaxID=1296538 RepID=A0A660DY05_9LACO|nr:MarR family transcriptional regulator [Lactiplantibacillus mudanjiangensis]VDG17878.1 MarR family transcriptional regulator [Lactobacillus sp.] [Lactiplantibacillus mudanjiangensis]VDG23327.1 MarR family transcriptional regulator [Lactobacillus sp.] [Lactiplantibacillus mudanjiangensis]VDG28290.1 MarR family transcriptional regulator [Lactobacillus sp.] [Lactiplantibacillus mudanjiangensis]VDG32423.1 MarR family transcriptional regulator [Lactobacillus sp.] [Lactiplantibacillus mudanjiangens